MMTIRTMYGIVATVARPPPFMRIPDAAASQLNGVFLFKDVKQFLYVPPMFEMGQFDQLDGCVMPTHGGETSDLVVLSGFLSGGMLHGFLYNGKSFCRCYWSSPELSTEEKVKVVSDMLDWYSGTAFGTASLEQMEANAFYPMCVKDAAIFVFAMKIRT